MVQNLSLDYLECWQLWPFAKFKRIFKPKSPQLIKLTQEPKNNKYIVIYESGLYLFQCNIILESSGFWIQLWRSKKMPYHWFKWDSGFQSLYPGKHRQKCLTGWKVINIFLRATALIHEVKKKNNIKAKQCKMEKASHLCTVITNNCY